MSKLSLASEFPQLDESAWRAVVDKALKGADFDKALVSRTYDGLEIRPLYTRGDESGADAASVPGHAPYTRGTRAAGETRAWDIRQLHASSGPAEANAAILEDLEGGVSSIALQVASPGQSGVKLDSPDDLARALEGVHLDMAGVWLEAGHGTGAAAAALQQLWSTRGYATDAVSGGFGADPLGVMARTGGLPQSLEQAMAEIGALATTTHHTYPNVTAVLADARPYHGSGGSEAQELACLCATTVAYLRALETAGLAPKDGLAQMTFALAADADLFLTIAKLRAARALIAQIAEASGAAEAMPGVRLHVMTSFRMFARRDPHVNMLRTTVAAAGAAAGGADSITVLPFSYALGQPDAFARRIARNIQIILQEESSLGAVLDPAGGSWYVENLTNDLAKQAWTLFQKIEAEGGMADALAKGTIQAMMRETGEARARDAALGALQMTGVSAFPDLAETPIDIAPHALAEEFEDPAVTVEPLPLRRPAEPFERLRDVSDAHRDKQGGAPLIFLANLGRLSDFNARATYAQSLFAAGGIDAVTNDGFESADAAADAFKASGAKIACLCSSDAVYDGLAEETARALSTAGATHVYLAGRPGDKRAAYKEAGIGTFVHAGCDILETLQAAHEILEIRAA